MTVCESYQRGKKQDLCCLDNTLMDKSNSTMCRKNPENCSKKKRKTSLGDYL